ncbi:MAG: hypothetical protein OXJ64_09625 [Boseongicola sp.]|nr:hypothetical protein [Boseongicola sp.]
MTATLNRLAAVAAATSMALVPGCARTPGSIPAATIDPQQYADSPCNVLALKHTEFTENLAVMESAQTDAATADALTVFFFLLPVGSIIGNDQEAAIGIAKGHINAIRTVQTRKGCI